MATSGAKCITSGWGGEGYIEVQLQGINGTRCYMVDWSHFNP